MACPISLRCQLEWIHSLFLSLSRHRQVVERETSKIYKISDRPVLQALSNISISGPGGYLYPGPGYRFDFGFGFGFGPGLPVRFRIRSGLPVRVSDPVPGYPILRSGSRSPVMGVCETWEIMRKPWVTRLVFVQLQSRRAGFLISDGCLGAVRDHLTALLSTNRQVRPRCRLLCWQVFVDYSIFLPHLFQSQSLPWAHIRLRLGEGVSLFSDANPFSAVVDQAEPLKYLKLVAEESWWAKPPASRLTSGGTGLPRMQSILSGFINHMSRTSVRFNPVRIRRVWTQPDLADRSGTKASPSYHGGAWRFLRGDYRIVVAPAPLGAKFPT